jgi:hypothetical protein
MKAAPISLSLLTSLALTIGAVSLSAGYTGCKKDEPPPPLPSAAPETTASAPPLELLPEDAGPLVEDADAAPPKRGKGGGGSSVKKCCDALQQNSHSAPEPNATYLKQAAATCYAMAAGGQGQPSVLGAISGMLRGAGMPAACR